MSEWNDALEAAARMLDEWADECDPEDYDERKMAGCYEHAAERIRLLKRAEPWGPLGPDFPEWPGA